MPTRRLVFAFALLVGVSALAVLDEGAIRIVGAADAVLLSLFVADLRAARRLSLTAERVTPPSLVQGSEAALEIRIRCGRDARIHLRETLHPALAEAPLRTVVRSASGEAVWRYELKPRRRGRVAFGPLVARIEGPLGLALSQRTLDVQSTVRVLPQVRWDGRVGHFLRLAHERQLGQNPLGRPGEGNEPYALREYRAGDPRSRVHWKASARRAHLVSREDTWERGVQLSVLLDCGRSMASPDGERGKLDWALAAVLALSRVAAARGDRVTIIAFSDRVLRTVQVRPGTRGAAGAYDALFDVEAERVESAYVEAARAIDRSGSRRAVALLLTSVVDIAAADSVRSALGFLSRRHRTLLVNLADPDLDRLAREECREPLDALVRTGALGIMAGNRRLSMSLRHAGITVASAPSRDLAAETLRVYLQRIV